MPFRCFGDASDLGMEMYFGEICGMVTSQAKSRTSIFSLPSSVYVFDLAGRGEWIRTTDLLVPNQAVLVIVTCGDRMSAISFGVYKGGRFIRVPERFRQAAR